MARQVDREQGSAAERVRLHVSWEAGTPVLALRGGLDVGSVAVVTDAMDAVMACERSAILDLGEIASADVQGLRPVARAAQALRRRGRTIVVRNRPPSVDRLLDRWPELANVLRT